MSITPSTLPSLQASPDLRAEFLSSVSHELRTSLNNIDGMAELLLDSHLSPQQSAFAQEVKISGRVLQSHLNDLLDFCRADLGKIELDNKDFELLSIVESTAEMFANEAHEKHISIMTFVDPDIPIRLKGDAARLQRVLLSMIASSVHNANCNEIVIRATLQSKDSKACKVRWEISSTRDQTHISLNGRVPANPLPNYPSTEVGRMLCNLMIELMGGKVETTDSYADGSNTRFTTVFGQSAATRPHQPTEDANGSVSKGLRVVVVDDSPANRLVISSYIRSWGMRHDTTDSVSNAHAALAALRRGASEGDPYDIAVIDLAMPEMDGVDLGHAIRQDPSLSGVALIMLTASDDPAQAKRALKAGFSAYLTKPVKQSHLLDSIFNVAYNKIGEQMGLNTEALTPEPAVVLPVAEAPHGNPKTRVMLVEDNPANQKLTLLQLDKLGYAAAAFSNGQEAIEEMQKNWDSYSLILMDCQMPVMDGYTATKVLRALEQQHRANKHKIPIIAITANVMEREREACLNAGMDDHVGKPINRDRLRDAIQKWI